MTFAVVVIGLLVRFAFYVSLSSLLGKIRQSNRELGYATIWAGFIPFIWVIMFPYMLSKLSVSLAFELSDLSVKTKSKSPALAIGIVYYIMTLIGGLLTFLGYNFHEDVLILLGIPCSVVGFIFFIIYWILIIKYNRILQGNLSGNQPDIAS